jgi:hypothetical protein
VGVERIPAIALLLADQIETVPLDAIKRTRRQPESERIAEVTRDVFEHLRSHSCDDTYINYTIALFDGLRDQSSEESFQSGVRLLRDAVSQALNDLPVWESQFPRKRTRSLLRMLIGDHIHIWTLDRGLSLSRVQETIAVAKIAAKLPKRGDHHD